MDVVEAKAKQVMELIDQFFTLAKLEAGDKNIEMVKLNINELCRENVSLVHHINIDKIQLFPQKKPDIFSVTAVPYGI